MAGLGVQLLSLVFRAHTRFTHHFSTYCRGLALFLVLATWVHLLAQLLLFGADFNRSRSESVPHLEQASAVALPEHAEAAGVEAQPGS